MGECLKWPENKIIKTPKLTKLLHNNYFFNSKLCRRCSSLFKATAVKTGWCRRTEAVEGSRYWSWLHCCVVFLEKKTPHFPCASFQTEVQMMATKELQYQGNMGEGGQPMMEKNPNQGGLKMIQLTLDGQLGSRTEFAFVCSYEGKIKLQIYIWVVVILLPPEIRTGICSCDRIILLQKYI